MKWDKDDRNILLVMLMIQWTIVPSTTSTSSTNTSTSASSASSTPTPYANIQKDIRYQTELLLG